LSTDALHPLAKPAKGIDQSAHAYRCAALLGSPMRLDRFIVRSLPYARPALHPTESAEGGATAVNRAVDCRFPFSNSAPLSDLPE
jgi:hypothetical protein